jgi:hypothetical protein
MPEMDQFAPAAVPTTLGELLEIHESISGKLQCHKEHHKDTVAI